MPLSTSPTAFRQVNKARASDYLKGISTGGFQEALAAPLGKDAGGLSASTIARLRDAWADEHTGWQERDLSVKRYVYFWADRCAFS
jgi:hypothetical protein